MLAELVVTDLGVIDGLSLVLDPGMTALTGETGAGKTMVVGAIGLLAGGRADPSVVRPGAREAVVEGRFVIGDDEHVLTRVVPRDGRSRAYRDGRPLSASELAEHAAAVDHDGTVEETRRGDGRRADDQHRRELARRVDELGDGVAHATEERVYGLLRERLADTSIVSIAHRPGVDGFHDAKIELVPSEAGATLRSTRRADPVTTAPAATETLAAG